MGAGLSIVRAQRPRKAASLIPSPVPGRDFSSRDLFDQSATVSLRTARQSNGVKQGLQLTSSDFLTGDQVAAKIGAAIARAVRFVDSPPEELCGSLEGKAPPFMVESVLRYFETVREGRWYTTTSVPEILGRSARSYDAWLRDNVAAFQ